MHVVRPLSITFAIGLAVLLGTSAAEAFSSSSTNYSIDDGVTNSFGGSSSSTEYGLTDSGGEAFIGPSSSTNYRFNAGYVAQLEHSISLSLDSLTKTIPGENPGTSQTATTVATVYTDAAGYELSAREDRDMTSASNGAVTISGVPGTIASPAAWTEGVTKGFGFTLTAGTAIESKWGTNPNYNYAAFPQAATVIHVKPGYTNSNDSTTIQYRLDVNNAQLEGTYTNNVTYSATVLP